MSSDHAPVVIVGAGLAGLTAALHLAASRPVVVLAKRSFGEAATAWAQGGIVGVVGQDDSIEQHVQDTQEAGAGLVELATARFVSERSADALAWLVEQGVAFTPSPARRWACTSPAKAATACDVSPMPPTPRAWPSTKPCWPARCRIRTSRCASG